MSPMNRAGPDPPPITDPRTRADAEAAGPSVVIVSPDGRVATEDVSDLGEDPEAWQAYISAAVGGAYDCTRKDKRTGWATYCAAGSDPGRAQLNPAATVLLADQDGRALAEAEPVFGTMLICGFDPGTWLPRPLSRTGLVAVVDAVAASDRFARAVVSHLKTPRANDPRL